MNNIRRSKRAADRLACGHLLVRDQSHDDELQSDQRAGGRPDNYVEVLPFGERRHYLEDLFRGSQRPVICSSFSGYRAPCTVIFEAASSISRRSSGVSLISTAPMFSSRRCSLVVPGIGTI